MEKFQISYPYGVPWIAISGGTYVFRSQLTQSMPMLRERSEIKLLKCDAYTNTWYVENVNKRSNITNKSSSTQQINDINQYFGISRYLLGEIVH